MFRDPFHVTMQDRIENGESRWQTYGVTSGLLLLLVAHTITEYDDDGHAVEVVRIISARPADRTERRRYEEKNA